MEIKSKKEAERLVHEYARNSTMFMSDEHAVQCSLIYVKGIIEELEDLEFNETNYFIESKLKFYQEVKQELKKIIDES